LLRGRDGMLRFEKFEIEVDLTCVEDRKLARSIDEFSMLVGHEDDWVPHARNI